MLSLSMKAIEISCYVETEAERDEEEPRHNNYSRKNIIEYTKIYQTYAIISSIFLDNILHTYISID